MTRDDIVQAARDLRMPDIDLSEIDLPKAIADRLPRRRRPNPLIPFVGLAAIGAAIAGLWWLFTSPVTGPRARHLAYNVKARLTGQPNDVIPYDNEANLGSLVDDARESRSTSGSNGSAGFDTGVAVGPGTVAEGVAPHG